VVIVYSILYAMLTEASKKRASGPVFKFKQEG
jgi:hypothetical protein